MMKQEKILIENFKANRIIQKLLNFDDFFRNPKDIHFKSQKSFNYQIIIYYNR